MNDTLKSILAECERIKELSSKATPAWNKQKISMPGYAIFAGGAKWGSGGFSQQFPEQDINLAIASRTFADFAARVLPGLVEAMVFYSENTLYESGPRALTELETAWKEAGR